MIDDLAQDTARITGEPVHRRATRRGERVLIGYNAGWDPSAFDRRPLTTAGQPNKAPLGEEVLQDLLTDLQHWATAAGVDWDEAVDAATYQWRHETPDV